MNTDKTTDTASQGLIDWAAAMAARTDQGSLNWRVETSLLLGYLAAAEPLVAPAPDLKREAKIDAWRDDALRSHPNQPDDPIRDPFLMMTKRQVGEAVSLMRGAAPDSALRAESKNILAIIDGEVDRNQTGLTGVASHALAIKRFRAALDAAPESDGGWPLVVEDGGMRRWLSSTPEAHAFIGGQSVKITDLKKQLAEATVERDGLQIVVDGIPALRERAEKAEAAADGNAGLRELLARLDAWEANDFAEGTRRAPDWIPRQTYRTEINRLLKAAPQPERDDGPLDRFVSGFQNGMDVSDRIDAAVAELCLRSGNVSEKARGPK